MPLGVSQVLVIAPQSIQSLAQFMDEVVIVVRASRSWPASRSCVRLLARDAEWIYYWGEPWQINGQGIIRNGTPVPILGKYDFAAPPNELR